MTDFTDRTFLVTGSGSGIGAATARRLANDGANVVLVGRTEDKLRSVAEGMPDGRALAVAADVSVQDDAQRMVSAATERFGGLDGLVVNAGVASPGRMQDFDPSDWSRIIDINLTGAYYSVRAAWEALSASGGSVVATSSVSGIGGDWGMFAYNASKGGLSNLVRALALEFKTSGIRVNAVAPSLTATGMMTDDEALLEKFRERIPMGRAAEPAEVAAVVAFLLGPDAGFVNGVVLPVDGGLSASNGQPPIN